MFTSVDKALAAVAGAAVFLLTNFGIDVTPDLQNTINTVVAVLTPILVYAMPNKDKT